MTDTPGNVELDGTGQLIIRATGHGNSWTSGRIQTVGSFTPPRGGEMMVTASLKLPDPVDGLGYWPAFWLLGPGAWPEHGEIDIVEDANGLSMHSGTMHCGNLTHRNNDGTTGPCHEFIGLTSGLMPCPGCLRGYHTYSVVIDRRNADNQQVRWYLDGRQFFSVREGQIGQTAWTQAVDHGFRIIFDLAIGGGYPNGNCGCTTPYSQTTSGASMLVRSVTVYDTARCGGYMCPA